jgi:hypothetical protein
MVQGRVVAYQRTLGSETTLVVTNYGTQPASIKIGSFRPRSAWVSAYPQRGKALVTTGQGVLRLGLPAQSVRVYTFKP